MTSSLVGKEQESVPDKGYRLRMVQQRRQQERRGEYVLITEPEGAAPWGGWRSRQRTVPAGP